ncbi:MAG: hypothetical protein WC511_05890 [Candidatus Pacearchaeota archaeon]|jgi:hypothetical protein
MNIPDKEDEPYEYTLRKLKEVKKLKFVSKDEKDLVYEIGCDVFSIGKEMENYRFSDAYRFVLDAFDLICDLLKKKRDSNIKISKIEEIAKDAEAIFKRVEEIEILIDRVQKNTEYIGERIAEADNLEREETVHYLIEKMRNQK